MAMKLDPAELNVIVLKNFEVGLDISYRDPTLSKNSLELRFNLTQHLKR